VKKKDQLVRGTGPFARLLGGDPEIWIVARGWEKGRLKKGTTDATQDEESDAGGCLERTAAFKKGGASEENSEGGKPLSAKGKTIGIRQGYQPAEEARRKGGKFRVKKGGGRF